MLKKVDINELVGKTIFDTFWGTNRFEDKCSEGYAQLMLRFTDGTITTVVRSDNSPGVFLIDPMTCFIDILSEWLEISSDDVATLFNITLKDLKHANNYTELWLLYDSIVDRSERGSDLLKLFQRPDFYAKFLEEGNDLRQCDE